MKRFNIYFLFTFLAAFGTISIQPPAMAEVCNRIVAVVNDDVVTLFELNGKLKELSGGIEPSEMEKQDPAAYIEARQKVLDMLIDEKLAQDKIRELGIEASSREVDAAVERIKRNNQWTHEDLVAALKEKGIKFNQYREKIKNEIEQGQLIDFEVKSKIIVSDEEIKQYFDDHIDEFRSDEKVRLGLILLDTEDPSDPNSNASLYSKAEEISLRLKQGEDFGMLAKQFSQAPNAKDGGDLGYILISQLDPKLKEIIDDTDEGSVSKPIVTQAGIQFLKIIDKQEKGIKSIEDVKDVVYDILYKDEINKRFSSWIKKLRDKAYIKVIF